MKQLLIIGRPNVGKTLFTLNFAAYLNMQRVKIRFSDSRGSHANEFPIREAVSLFVSEFEHQTRSLHSITIELAWGKGWKQVELIDSTGLVEGIHSDQHIRQAMGQTLTMLRSVSHIIHIIDASEQSVSQIDKQLAEYGRFADSYVTIANKWDLVTSPQGVLQFLQKELGSPKIIPVSSLHMTGFERVKQHVRRII